MPPNGHNGNGSAIQTFNGLPPWLATMRQAAMECISADDVKAIVQKQVELAKAGDEKAMKFVFEQVLGGAALKGASFHQHIHEAAPREAEEPTPALPGTVDKIEAMSRRVAKRQSVFHGSDAQRDLS